MKLPLFSLPLRYFVVVARTGSVSEAARQLHVAASAVSRQIGLLEDALGLRLFERARRGMTPTPAGERCWVTCWPPTTKGWCWSSCAGWPGASACAWPAPRALPRAFWSACCRISPAHPAPSWRCAWWRPTRSISCCARARPIWGSSTASARKGCGGAAQRAGPGAGRAAPGHPLAGGRVRLAEALRYPLLLGEPGTTSRRLFDQAWPCRACSMRRPWSAISRPRCCP
jgi:hypothetical protein